MKRVALLLLFLPITAQAWTRASEERIAQKAAVLAPSDLGMILERFQPEYLEGIAAARADEGSENHYYVYDSRTGRLRERLQRETTGIIAMIRKGEPMSSVAMRLGVLAHLVSDANNPFHTAETDERMRALAGDYEAYFERRLPRFPTFFYGLSPSTALDPYLDRMLRRSALFYPLLVSEYFPKGVQQSSSSFDDRSTAFGVASVSYSHAVTDLVNLYFYVWKQSGGDVRTAPSLRMPRVIR